METTLKENVSKCVEGNIHFDGKIGTVYSVQDLFHNLGQRSLNELYKATKKKLDTLDTDSLFSTSNTKKKNLLELQVDTIKGVFAYNQEKIDKEKRKSEIEEKVARLKDLRERKELEEFEGKSTEEIDKEIEKLQEA